MGRLTFESVQDERTRNRRPASKAFPAEPSSRSERPHGSRRARARAPHDGNAHGQRGKKFQIRENLFPETGTRNSRSSAQQRCSPAQWINVAVAFIAGGGPPVTQSIGRPIMSKRIALLS